MCQDMEGAADASLIQPTPYFPQHKGHCCFDFLCFVIFKIPSERVCAVIIVILLKFV